MTIVFEGTLASSFDGATQIMSFSESWRLRLPTPTPFGLQVVERAVVDLRSLRGSEAR